MDAFFYFLGVGEDGLDFAWRWFFREWNWRLNRAFSWFLVRWWCFFIWSLSWLDLCFRNSFLIICSGSFFLICKPFYQILLELLSEVDLNFSLWDLFISWLLGFCLLCLWIKRLLLLFEQKVQTICFLLFNCYNFFRSFGDLDRVVPILFLSDLFALAQNPLIPLYSFCELLLSLRDNFFKHFIFVWMIIFVLRIGIRSIAQVSAHPPFFIGKYKIAPICQISILLLAFVLFILRHLDRRSEEMLVVLSNFASILSRCFRCFFVVILAEMLILGSEYLQILLMELLFHRQLYYNTIFI